MNGIPQRACYKCWNGKRLKGTLVRVALPKLTHLLHVGKKKVWSTSS